MNKVYKKVLINELIRILKRSIKRKLSYHQKNNNDNIKFIIQQIVNYSPFCNYCNQNLIRVHNQFESIYEIREDWCIDYDKTNYFNVKINGLICRNCNLNRTWNSMQIDSPEYQSEPMDID